MGDGVSRTRGFFSSLGRRLAAAGSKAKSAAGGRARLAPKRTQPRDGFDPGTPRVGATLVASVKARVDARRVAAAAQQNPQNGAQMLRDLMVENPSPSYRADLARESRPQIEELGRTLSSRDPQASAQTLERTLGLLAESSDLAGPEAAREMAVAFARHIPEGELKVTKDGLPRPDRLGGALAFMSAQGKGGAFSVELATALTAAGKGRAAEDVLKATAFGMEVVREDFQKKADRVDELNGQLMSIVNGFSAFTTDEEKQRAIDSFKETHQADYAAFETSSERMARMAEAAGGLDDAVAAKLVDGEFGRVRTLSAFQEQSARVLEELPRFGLSEKGGAIVADNLEAQGRGERSFLDVVERLSEAKGEDERKGFDESVSNALAQAATTRAMTLGASDKQRQADLFAGLAENHALFGVPRRDMESATADLRDVASGVKPPNILQRSSSIGGAIFKDTQGGTALRGVALALSIPDFVNKAQGLSDQGVAEQFQTLASGLGLSGSVGGLGLNVFKTFGNPTENQLLQLGGKAPGGLATASQFFKSAGQINGLVNISFNSVNALKSFGELEIGDGLNSSVDAASAYLATFGGPMGAVGALGLQGMKFMVNDFAAQISAKKAERRFEGNIKPVLEDLGFKPQVADKLGDLNKQGMNVGQLLGDVSGELGLTPAQLRERMNGFGQREIDRLGDLVNQLEKGQNLSEGLSVVGSFDEQGAELIRRRNVEGAAELFRELGVGA